MATQTKIIKQADARTQTANPNLKVSETQTANKNVDTGSKSVQTQAQAPLMFDIAQDDNSEQLANDIEMESQYQSGKLKKKKG